MILVHNLTQVKMAVKTFFVYELNNYIDTIRQFLYKYFMDLKTLSKKQLTELSTQIKYNPEHLRKVAIRARPCSRKLAELIEAATFGAIKKEKLLWPDN